MVTINSISFINRRSTERRSCDPSTYERFINKLRTKDTRALIQIGCDPRTSVENLNQRILALIIVKEQFDRRRGVISRIDRDLLLQVFGNESDFHITADGINEGNLIEEVNLTENHALLRGTAASILKRLGLKSQPFIDSLKHVLSLMEKNELFLEPGDKDLLFKYYRLLEHEEVSATEARDFFADLLIKKGYLQFVINFSDALYWADKDSLFEFLEKNI